MELVQSPPQKINKYPFGIRRNQSSLLARANELGAQVRDGALWVGAGVAGFVLLALEVIARLLGLDLRFRP